MTTEILLVEDNAGDAYLFEHVIKTTGAAVKVKTVADGVEALDYLYRRGQYTDAVRPDLILLDLNLPRKSGLEVLTDIKNDESLPRVPIVVFSMSKDEEDIRQSYGLRAASYITKPVNLGDFEEVIKTLEQYWLGAVVLPPNTEPPQP